ncbi:hypothetical protein BKA62DRAFT_753780 [Auriculariales sp. MPI-PUGE-AT-0066]|nr:hypothetical protein BKA62DRAFT_753780 [Auriculariales sp. MPI-PUGE-AT-0066]
MTKPKDTPSTRVTLDQWDLLAEGAASPLAWAPNGVQFSAHPLQPQVVGCVFPSRRTFTLPVPTEIMKIPAAYGPPTLLTTTSFEREHCAYLFAYFPIRGRSLDMVSEADAGGIGCLYSNTTALTNAWNVVHASSFPRNGGAVACRWLGETRRWYCTDNETLQRRPLLGPPAPLARPCLLVVTQSQHACIISRSNTPLVNAQVFTRSSLVSLNVPKPSLTPSTVHHVGNGLKICTKASIGLGYQGSSAIIAMHCVTVPSSIHMSPSNSTDIPGYSSELPLWTEEEEPVDTDMIDICEVTFIIEKTFTIEKTITVEKWATNLRTLPLQPISGLINGGAISSMLFVPGSPNLKSPKESDVKMYLVVNLVDFHAFSTDISTRLELIAFRNNSSGNRSGIPTPRDPALVDANDLVSAKAPYWIYAKCTSKTLARQGETEFSGIAVYLDVTDDDKLCALLVNPANKVPLSGSKGSRIGYALVLNLPDLEPESVNQPIPLFGVIQDGQLTLPLSACSSPNGALLCSSQPRFRAEPESLPVHLNPSLCEQYARRLAIAIVSQRSIADVIFAMRSLEPAVAQGIQVETLHILESHAQKMRQANSTTESSTDIVIFTRELLGASLELHRQRRTQNVKHNELSSKLDEMQWNAGRDFCSLMSGSSMFSAASIEVLSSSGGGRTYDSAMVWPLISMTRWIVQLVERLVRECIYLEGSILLSGVLPLSLDDDKDKMNIKRDPGTPPPPPKINLDDPVHPTLILIIHPVASAALLQILLHIESFVQFMKLATTKGLPMLMRGDDAYVAGKALEDIVGMTPVNLTEMRVALQKAQQDAKALNVVEQRKMLFTFAVPEAPLPDLVRIFELFTAPQVSDKPRLFFDVNSQLDVTAVSRSRNAKRSVSYSIVTKMPLAPSRPVRRCVRCGEQAEPHNIPQQPVRSGVQPVAQQQYLLRINAWMSAWIARCPCGGQWMAPR